MSNLEQLQQAIKEARSIQVEGAYLSEGKKALQEAGYKYVEEITFEPSSGLRGSIYRHPATSRRADISTGSFFGPFTELVIH